MRRVALDFDELALKNDTIYMVNRYIKSNGITKFDNVVIRLETAQTPDEIVAIAIRAMPKILDTLETLCDRYRGKGCYWCKIYAFGKYDNV